jgi:ABC-2 type transport system ATP-binding protein
MIEVEHLQKIYGSTVAISDVHFSVAKGEILGFLGPNGAGKTTTMRILSGYIPANAGTARIAGFDVHEDSMQVRRHIGYLPENPPLYEHMSVESYLHFVANIKGIAAGDRQLAVTSALKKTGLADKAKVIIAKLSKGYRQRVGLAQAIVHSPEVIILDEPTVGLDPKQILEVRNLIKGLGGEHTVLLSSHILPEVSMTCDRVTIVNQGTVITTDKPENLMDQLLPVNIYKLLVEGDVYSIKSTLESLDGVNKVDIIPVGSRFSLEVFSSDKYDHLAKDLAKVVINSGLDLYEMNHNRPTLEEVFLKLTTQEQ